MSKALPKGLSIINHNGLLLVQLYKTLIASVDTNTGLVKLDSGLKAIGRKSRHTKKCLNLALSEFDMVIKQKSFNWTVHHTRQGFFNSSQTNYYHFDTEGYCNFNYKQGGS